MAIKEDFGAPVTTTECPDGTIRVMVHRHANSASPRARSWYGVIFAVYFRGKWSRLPEATGVRLDNPNLRTEASAKAKELARQVRLQLESGVWHDYMSNHLIKL